MKTGVCFVAVGLAAVMLLAGCAAGNPGSEAETPSVAPEKTEEETDLDEYIDIEAPFVIGDNDNLFEPLISEIEKGYSGVFENGLTVCFGLGKDFGALAFQDSANGVSGCYVGELTENGNSLTIKDMYSGSYRLDLGDLGAGFAAAVSDEEQ
ncbi:MAG: hypothetical protein LBN26_05250 [Christensenellaceae bacterium]|jgi:hypothetical protein|nr:hypothetical protein [Christensenellaceae bacterium]